MTIGSVSPTGLSKYLVGQWFEVAVALNPDFEYTVELDGKLTDETIRFEKDGLHYTAKVWLKRSGFFDYSIRFRKKESKQWRYVTDSAGRKKLGTVQVDPSWLSQAVVYCIFVRFFKGREHTDVVGREPASLGVRELSEEELTHKNIRGESMLSPGSGGTFDDVKAYLDTLASMHVNVLYFNPIHLIGELYRGYNMLDQLPSYLQPGSPYSIKDYKSIDPELTYDRDTKKHLLSDPQQEFKDLIDAAHTRGMFIVMDLVFNHTAHDFIYQRIRPEWYLYKEHINSLEDPYLYPDDVKKGKPWGDPRHSMAPYDHGVWWEDTAQLNWEYKLPEGPNPPPPNYSLNEMWEYFKSIPQYWIRRFGVDGFRCDVAYRIPPRFWKACIAEARQTAREAKTNRSHDVIFVAESYTSDLDTLQKAGFTAVYGDFSHKLGTPLQLKGYLDYIYNLSGDNFPPGSRWFHFPDSHDFDRSPRKVLGDNAGDSAAALLANQSRWLLTSTLPGVPLLFNGFEMIEWQPINIWSYGAIRWHEQADMGEFIQKTNSIRRKLLPLTKGTYTFVPTNQGLSEQTQLFCFIRKLEKQLTLVVVNMDVYHQAGPAQLDLPEWFPESYVLFDHLHNRRYERQGRELTVVVPPGDGHIFEVRD